MIWSGQAWAHRALYNITRSFPATFPVLKATRLPLPALLQQAASGQYYVSILKLLQLGINRSQISFRNTMQHYSDSLIRQRILLRKVGAVESTISSPPTGCFLQRYRHRCADPSHASDRAEFPARSKSRNQDGQQPTWWLQCPPRRHFGLPRPPLK